MKRTPPFLLVRKSCCKQVLSLLAILFLGSSCLLKAQDPSTNQTFEQAVTGMQGIGWYRFGTNNGCTICNQTQLAQVFDPYGIAGKAVIHEEWEIYQPFNNQNFVLTGDSLNLTTSLPSGSIAPGRIDSGQIWTKNTYQPGVTGYNTYAFMVRMKIPGGKGMWPATWLYSKQNGNGSEVDIAEFEVMQWQNSRNWTGFNHGSGAESIFYSLLNNPYVWTPGFDFASDYHNYEVIWTTDAVFQYVDGRLVQAQSFRWTASGPAQLGVNLAVGSSNSGLPGLIPDATSFPASLNIEYIVVLAK